MRIKKTFYKNLFRDIGKTISRFLSIVAIIAIGVAFYAGVRATSPDMKISGDMYLNQNNFMDYRLISTMGLTKDDVAEVEKLPGIAKAEGTYTVDAVIEKDEHELVVNVNALPAKDGLNQLRLVTGRLPENSNEAVVEAKFLKSQKLELGDEIILKSGKETSLNDNLKNTKFKIVGTAQSAMYISAQRQLSSVGNGSVRGFVYILPEVFKSEVFTEMFVKVDDSAALKSLENNNAYKEAVSGIEASLKELGKARSKVRYEDIMSTALGKINDAESKLEKSRKEAADKIADGYKKIDEARVQLAKGEKELAKNSSLLDKKLADGREQLADGRKQLEAAKSKLEAGKQQAAGNISGAIGLKAEEAKKLAESDPTNPAYAAQYGMLSQLYENCIKGKDFDSMYAALDAQGALPQLQSMFDITALKLQFDQGAAEIEQNQKKLEASEAQLDKAEAEGKQKLAAAKKKLEDGNKEIQANTEKLKSEEAKANKAIADGEEEIQKNRDKLNDIKEPVWYVLGRSANVGYETYRLDSDRISNIGKVFPLIFFLVAALVSLTTMTRLVLENRTEVGTLKALGYSGTRIVSHYLIYSLSASLLGSLLGISFAFKLFPSLIMNAYRSLYTIPEHVTPFNMELAVQASLLAILFTTVAAVAATIGELREVPASLMRPRPPKSGKTIFLEKIGFIWKRLSFTNKVTARNLFRYKQRLLMTVIGIAACTGLMLTGFGLKWGITGATEKQFNEIYRYNMIAAFDKTLKESELGTISASVMKNTDISTIMFAYNKNGSVKDGASGSQDVYVIVPGDAGEFGKYVWLTMKGKDLLLGDDGVILTEKLAKLIGKKPGDSIEITLNDNTYTARVSAVTEHYVQHYVYMSPAYYKSLTGKDNEYNELYGLLKDTSETAENKISKTLAEIKNIGSISYRNNTYIDSSKSMDSVNSVVLILIISAAVLAFVVIYNLTNININERKRELATIKLLGFFDNELALYIYRENIVLTIIGSLLGILLGILMTSYVLEAAETNVMLFMKLVQPMNILYSVLLTIVFSLVVNIVMRGEFKKIDMIESLKSAE